MQRVLEIIERHISSLAAAATRYEAQTGPQAPVMAAVHHFAAATLADVKREIGGGVTQ